MRSDSLHHPILRFPILLFMLLIILLEFPGSRDLIETPYSGIETLNLTVKSLSHHSPNANKGIEPNDEIIAIDGQRIRNYNHLRYVVHQNTDFAPQSYRIARGADTTAVMIDYGLVPSSLVHRRFGRLLVGFTFLLTGLLVVVRRVDSIGILFSLNCAIISYWLSDRPVLPYSALQLAVELFDDAVMVFFPAVFLHFFRVFPADRPRPVERRVRARRMAVIYGFPTVLFVFSAFFAVRNFFFVPTPSGVVTAILAVSTLYTAWYILASLIVFVRKYRLSTTAQRQKLRIAIAGTVAGIVPFLSVTVFRQIMPGSYTLWEFLSSLALAFVSVSFAYAILKHGAIELNIVVRKSIVYTFLTGVIIAAYYGLVRVLGDYLTAQFNLEPVYFSIVAVLVLAVIFAPARELVQGVVDRLFLRGDYDYKNEVVEFNRQISTKLTRTEILGYFSQRLDTLLKSSYFAFYKRNHTSGELELDRPAGAAALPAVFPRDTLLWRYLSRYRKPLMVEYLDYSWGRRHLDATSSELLDTSKAAVCLPLGSTDSLTGLILLGPKRSGLLYTRADSELLETLSEHLGLVLENAELHEGTIEQERLKNEVLLAREIQLSLIPKSPPRHPSLQLSGRMASSVEVGGDYFDYFELEPGRIGIVIGDVSGKGVPAAMLMSSLQAVFKNVAVRDRMDPAAVIGELNAYLCGHCKPEQFATFFYGILDLGAARFTFCNAGHCPALLLKRHYVDRLGEGGMILGIQPDCRYREGRVRIDSGDVICLYTDGVTEQKNQTDDEYGEANLIEFLRANGNLPVEDLQESLFASVLAFGNGRQHDDITNVIARYIAA